MSEWKTYRLGDIIQLKSGGTPDKSNPDYWGGSIPWISAKSMYDDFISTSDLFITEEGLQAGSKIAKKDSILLLTRGSGLFNRIPVCYVVSDVAYNQDVKNIVLKQEDVTSIKFLYYWLYGNKELLSSMLETTGIGAGKIDTKRFLNLSISLPSQKEQARYIHLMDLLFDKIELNRRINANLEAQAQALFRSWFVDNETQNNNPGFFNDIIQTTLSGDWGQETPKGNYISEVYCIRGADIPDIKCGDKGKLPTRYILEKNLTNKKLSENDLVVEISGGSPTQSTGRICLITRALLDRLGKDVICTNFCRALKPIPEYSFFIYLYWQYLYNNNTMFSYENGTTGIKNLNITDFINKEPIIIPEKKKILEFNKVLHPIFDMIYKNGRENEQLSALRDTLLPKLMAGEIAIE